MFDITKLRIAYINDIPFYCTSSENTSGVKWVKDELPQGGRVINNNGKIEDIFEISGQIEYENWKKLKNQVIDVGEEATLTLPFHVDIQQVFIDPHKSTIFDKGLIGLVRFSLTCNVSSVSSVKSAVIVDSENDIRIGKEDLRNSLISFVQGKYRATVDTLSDVTNKINSVANIIQESANTIQTLTDPLIELLQSIDNLQGSVTSLLNTPEIIAIQLGNIFASFEQIGATTISQFEIAKNLLNTNYFDIILRRSQITEEKDDAITPINQYIWVDAMNVAIYSASQSDFENLTQLNDARDYINKQYLDNYNKIEDADILIKMQSQIAKMNNALLKKEASLSVSTIAYYHFTDPYTVSYQLYGNLDNVDKIIKLNQITDYTNINGEISIYL